jgi:hypothetical protein
MLPAIIQFERGDFIHMNVRALLAGAALAALMYEGPARAADTALILWNQANPGDFESALGTGSADLTASNFDGVTVTLSFVSRGTLPNDLTEGNIGIRNTTDTVQTLRIIAGANNYLGPSNGFTLTSTIGATLGGSDLTGSFFTDQTNSLNGQGFTITGTDIGDFNSGALTGPQSFSFNGLGFDSLKTPYGLAESLSLTLQPGASVFVQGISMDANAVPEPKTWAMLGIGFGLMAIMGFKRRHKASRFAIEA